MLVLRIVLASCVALIQIPSWATASLDLPAPGTRVSLTAAFDPAILKGIKVTPNNPFQFDFILHPGETKLSAEDLKAESSKLIRYFLAAITTPEKDLWVNLSPYEKDRIVPTSFGQTEMGRDLLAQDYLLKQITASLSYPDDLLGKEFWSKIYAQARQNSRKVIPVNTFNRVWIMPEKAVVYENAKAGTAYVIESRLKVMMEEDYVALKNNQTTPQLSGTAVQPSSGVSSITRELILPQLTQEVNFGHHFAQLRQVYNSLILATWYKKKIKDSLFGEIYANQNKITGVNIADPQEKQRIYERYLQAFKKGAYHYIKQEEGSGIQHPVVRKYFSGGTVFDDASMTPALRYVSGLTPTELSQAQSSQAMIVNAELKIPDALASLHEPEHGAKVSQAMTIPSRRHHSQYVYNELLVPPAAFPAVVSSLYSFEEYMEDALHHPQWGYYYKGSVQIGEHFWTDPELFSPIYGHMVADHAFTIWKDMVAAGDLANGEQFEFIEFGAGTGVLALDVLEYLNKKAKENTEWNSFAKSFHYKIIERSKSLKNQQSVRLRHFGNQIEIAEGDARNLTKLESNSVKGVVFSNELPDAFGAQKVVFNGQGQADVAFVVPRLSKRLPEALELLKAPAELIREIQSNDQALRQQLALSQDGIFVDKNIFRRLMSFVASLGNKEQAILKGSLKFAEVYVPAGFVPQVAQHIRDHIDEYSVLIGHSRGDFVHYINLGADEFIRGISRVLNKGYVITIDYGHSTAELLARHDLEYFGFRSMMIGDHTKDPYRDFSGRDMTTDINFSIYARTGKQEGLELAYYGTREKIVNGTSIHIGSTLADTNINFAAMREQNAFKDFRSGALPRMITRFLDPQSFKIIVQRRGGTLSQNHSFPVGNSSPFSRAEDVQSANPYREKLLSYLLDHNSAMTGRVGQQSTEDTAEITNVPQKASRTLAGFVHMATLRVPSRTSSAQVSMDAAPTGGIDLASEEAFQIPNGGAALTFHLDRAQVQQLRMAPGFVPVIIDIQPLRDWSSFLGNADK